MYWQQFKMDAARWVKPQGIAPMETVTFSTILKLLFRHLPLRAMAWFRFGSWCKAGRIPFLPGYVQRQIYRRYGLEIQSGAAIGGGLYIAHPVGCVIMVARMGQNCSVISAVTCGMRNEWRFPIIGDDVFIGAGARVLGGIELADGCQIGANAVVIRDVPAGATAVGVPARILGEVKSTTVAPPQAEPALPVSGL